MQSLVNVDTIQEVKSKKYYIVRESKWNMKSFNQWYKVPWFIWFDLVLGARAEILKKFSLVFGQFEATIIHYIMLSSDLPLLLREQKKDWTHFIKVI